MIIAVAVQEGVLKVCDIWLEYTVGGWAINKTFQELQQIIQRVWRKVKQPALSGWG